MKNFFFETETTGLPNNYKGHYSETENWPRIVQLSWLIADAEGSVLAESDYIIKVDFKIPRKASRIHGITNAVAEKRGVVSTLLNGDADVEDLKNVVGKLGELQSTALPSL